MTRAKDELEIVTFRKAGLLSLIHIFLYSGTAPVKSNDQKMHPFAVNRNFYYLTGIETQSVWLVLAKTAGTMAEYLFIDCLLYTSVMLLGLLV